MNNLCCQLNPLTRCEGCNTQWCKSCEDTDDVWYSYSKSHPYQNDGTWLCPIGGKVTLSNFKGITTVIPV